MAVSSIKGCWYKFSARIRDYIDVVDSYYRPPSADHDSSSARLEELIHQYDDGTVNRTHTATQNPQNNHSNHHYYTCDRSSTKDKRHSQSHHHHHHNCGAEMKPVFSRWPRGVLDCSASSQLPPGFSKRKTSQGQVYFVDAVGQKYWHDPSVPKDLLVASLDLDSLVGRLSEITWEVKQTPSGKTYYVNHIKKTTQFTDPRLVAHKDFLMNILKNKQCSSSSASGTKSGSIFSTSTTPATHKNNQYHCQYHCGSLVTKPGNTSSHRSSISNINTQSVTRNCHKCSPHNNPQRTKPSPTTANDEHRLHTNASYIANLTRNRPSPSCQQTRYRRNLLSESHQNLSSTAVLARPDSPLRAFTKHPSGSETRTPNENIIPENQQQVDSVCNTNTLPSTNRSSSLNVSQCQDNLLPLISANITHISRDQQVGFSSERSKDLSDKIAILRQELLKQQVIAHPCRIDINRKRIFEESFKVISPLHPRDLKKRLLVKFRGEEGLDYGGVAREWFYLLSREILNPIHGLFQYTSDDIYNLQINPDSGIVYREHLSYLNFCGRVIGMAVFHGHFIEGHFTIPFYKMLLKKPINLADIEHVDPDLYRSLCWILENNITDVIDTTFLVQHNAFGELQEHELKENGRNIVVTEANKHEYVSRYVNYRCRRGIESQSEALANGFNELISPDLLENFNEHELELLIGGLSKIDIVDWRQHTKLKNCNSETPLVKWFWETVKSYSEDKRARLLQFVTGSPRVPIQGFKALQGVNSELRLFTIHLIRNACTDNLPKSHTCFNRIDLPPYESYEKLHDKLTTAIEETMGFAMQ